MCIDFESGIIGVDLIVWSLETTFFFIYIILYSDPMYNFCALCCINSNIYSMYE